MRELVAIPDGVASVEGLLEIPPHVRGMVLFAHGSGSGRHSPRNQFVAQQLQLADMGTLLVDLLTPEEDHDTQSRFDIELLASRLAVAAAWLRARQAGVALGLFGASTGAAAALRLAAQAGIDVVALVSRGGRPDLAGNEALHRVRAPTLLIVGGDDDEVLALNQKAYAQMHCEKRLEIVAGATHLFEEPGRLEEAAMLAVNWFSFHFPRPRPRHA
ncbi:alpha/beta hydrolase [Noviherbaspirillum sp. DKR-6]|uniref:Alpha/beta hydrolase n=2 Tax=Noviherbaspirillum pedocola TaxID=2801341 RepID=A0A934T2I9_9BURK|nr:alpha/beta hydrolase [Noviherbaspirillum pedocola]